MSNVSVILCVRHLIKDNCYSNINTVTEPMQCNYSTLMLVVNTNNFGAFQVEKNESHEASVKMVDLNIYNVEFVVSVQQNQMIGETPNYCIPLTINAITVQGISYSDPYFSSFNLNYKMAFGAPEHMNKSDYAFKSSVCIIRDEPCDTQLLNDKSAHNMISKTKTRIITNEDKSVKTYHDNNELEVGYDKPANKTALRMFANGDLTFDAMLELTKNEDRIIKEMKTQDVDSWGVPRRLRLCGGGESSLNTATGWGSPPASNNAGNWGGNSSGQTNNGTNNTQQWNNTAQRPPTSQADMNSNKGNGNQMPPTSGASAQNWQSSPPNMPNAQPNNNGAPTSNGTNNAGNGNNGGTNPPNSTSNSNGPTSANGNNGNNANSTSSAKIEQLNSMREALFSQDGWGGQHVNQDTNWDVPGTPEPGPGKVENQPAGGPPAWKPNINNGAFLGTDLWEANLRNGGQPPPQPASKTPWGHTPTTNIGGTWGEDDDVADSANVWTGPPPPQQWPAGPPQHAQQWGVPKKDDWNAWGESHRPVDPRIDPHRSSDPRQQSADPRHDLRGGISGRLNGDMWSQHHQHTAGPNKMMPGGVNQWGAQGPKDPIKGSGWEEPSPPAARRAPGGFDDGTSLWAQRGMGGMAARGPQGPPGPQRMPPTPTKPDAVWGAHAQRNGSWEEPHTPAWPDRDAPAWPDASGPALWPVPKPKPAGPGTAWPDDIGEWGGPKPQQGGPLGKQLPKEMVWNSKQFRFLVEMGFKKEEAEAALRSRDMNAEEALEMLASARGDGWRRDEHFGGHHGGPFQPPPSVPAVSPAVVQKILNQPPPPTQQHHQSYNPNSGTGNGGQPSAAQLRMLVQQIQMAVSAGYLNHQILNQPLAPQTLVLLNQLLQQIKVLQQLLQQNSLAMTKGHSSLALQYSVQITKAKQQITALQNQITAQQALYMKQQAGSSDLFKQGHDPIAQLQNNFSDMTIPKDTQGGYGSSSGNQQSRLNQWKLPSLDKDGEGSEFSRAPGTAKSTTSPQLNQLGLQPDSTWGVGRGSEGWGDSSADVADGKDAWPSHPVHQPVYDLVPEFEPGKPWKGNQMKNVEDDPAMTPGSVVRSPLSLAAIKDSDMLGGKTSPPGGERSLSSSTWSYAPPGGAGAGAGLKSDAWGAKPRPAPPGLNKAWPQHHNNAPPRAVPSWQASTWLLLKNLTAQIDGSTLKTLCVQHGPLQNFHLYLNQGLALARYSTREEAAKAQMALNNCVLSNTTIFAESPAESEVQLILQHLGSGGGGAWRGGQKDGWGGFAALWPDSHDQRATPSSLNSFLPPDLLGESLVISRCRKAFHGVMFHPSQSGILTSANARDGAALWDLRAPKHPVIRYAGGNGTSQNCMSVRFNSAGTHILALRRRQAPVLYAVHSSEPVAEFFHQDYYNSCTMKSSTFAGEDDKFVMSGSDDFNLYMWKIPEDGAGYYVPVAPPHIVLYGHRSIVNQVRYNPHYCLIASSGVEKIIKVWSALEFPKMRGTLLEEAQGSDNPREIYSHEDYVSLVHHSGQYISHNYADQSTSEDPRMMAFFDSLVQRELECLGDETDSLDGSSSCHSTLDNDSDSSDTDQIILDFLPLPRKRVTANQNGNRSQRVPNRLARLVAQRYPKNLRSQKRGSLRRSKQSRVSLSKSSSKCVSGASGKGKRPVSRRVRGPRRPAPRTLRPANHSHSRPTTHSHSRVSAPSSERTDSDEPTHSMFRNSGRMIRPPLRRRVNLTRTAKRKNKVTSYRKPLNLRSNGAAMAQDSSDNNNFSNFDNFDDNLAQPSTSTGYRGQSTSGLFRIVEVDSDDDQSVSSRPISPRNQNGNQSIPQNLVSIIPTPINGSRDSLGESLRVEPPESESNNSSPPPPEHRRMNLRRVRRNGRLSLHRSDSSESPPPKEPGDRASTSTAQHMEQHSPKVGYNRTVARLMNETNESELESSCSTESCSMWPPAEACTPDSGVGTVAGSSTRNPQPTDDVSDDPEYQAFKFRQRVKKARRNYREHMDSDSN